MEVSETEKMQWEHELQGSVSTAFFAETVLQLSENAVKKNIKITCLSKWRCLFVP